MHRTNRFLLIAVMVIVGTVALPWGGLWMDRMLSLIWRLPFWTEPLSLVMLIVGVCIAVLCLWEAASRTDGTHDSAPHPKRSEPLHPLRRSLNPLLLSGWLCGTALAFLLRSPFLFGCIGIIVIVHALYARSTEGAVLPSRFGGILVRYAKRMPRWLLLLVIAGTTAVAVPALTVDPPSPPMVSEPAILVQVRCKPGTSFMWQADFEQHIKPAIDEVIARGAGFTSFQFIQSTLPWQSFDFALLYTGKTFADLDQPKAPPHYAALFRREGSIRAINVLREMTSYEEQVNVTLVHLSGRK